MTTPTQAQIEAVEDVLRGLVVITGDSTWDMNDVARKVTVIFRHRPKRLLKYSRGPDCDVARLTIIGGVVLVAADFGAIGFDGLISPPRESLTAQPVSRISAAISKARNYFSKGRTLRSENTEIGGSL